MHTLKSTRRGFTLIELLVVVLIISILAAVALPQYNKAVAKTRAVEIISILNAGEKAMNAWILANGYKDAGVDDLDIQIPITDTLLSDHTVDIRCAQEDLMCFIAAYGTENADFGFGAEIYPALTDWSHTCTAFNKKGAAVCAYVKQVYPNTQITDESM